MKNIEVPRFPEISVKRVLNDMRDNEEVLSYLPDLTTESGKNQDRTFLYNTVNTIVSDYFINLMREIEETRIRKA